MYETKPYFYGTGRRKDSVARVRVYTGTGKTCAFGIPVVEHIQPENKYPQAVIMPLIA